MAKKRGSGRAYAQQPTNGDSRVKTATALRKPKSPGRKAGAFLFGSF
jgi:hypothetical protein